MAALATDVLQFGQIHPVLYQPTQGSTVWLYDEAGSRDLGIKSHDLSELKEAISEWLKGNARVSDIRWIEE